MTWILLCTQAFKSLVEVTSEDGMITETEIQDLMVLWDRLLGRVPDRTQFEIWAGEHAAAVIQHGILKTAAKNAALNRQMDDDHRARYASSVMNNWERSPRPLSARATAKTMQEENQCNRQ